MYEELDNSLGAHVFVVLLGESGSRAAPSDRRGGREKPSW